MWLKWFIIIHQAMDHLSYPINPLDKMKENLVGPIYQIMGLASASLFQETLFLFY